MILIIGAGAVGVNVALLLDRLGYAVVLIDSSRDLLAGSTRVTFINHGDGLEYYKPHHCRTGQLCIEGSMTKALLYPLGALSTTVCDSGNPIRFVVAKSAVQNNEVSLSRFFLNASDMAKHFSSKFNHMRIARNWTEEEATAVFLRRPGTFWRKIPVQDLTDMAGIAGGCYGSSFGVNMPHYYSFIRAALRQSTIDCLLGIQTDCIERIGDKYTVHTSGGSFSAEHVLLCTSHHIPSIASKIRVKKNEGKFAGTYYLNSMTFLVLPATRDDVKLKSARRINFCIQGKHGGMFACLSAPSPQTDGAAAIYLPDPSGSQRDFFAYKLGDNVNAPKEWDSLIDVGLPGDSPAVRATFKQACALYPFLKDYARVERTVCRPVFNAAVRGSHGGLDRRVREIPSVNGSITADGQISAWAAPKWTSAELVALQATDYVHSRLKKFPFPKSEIDGYGPAKLDVARITQELNFLDVRPLLSDARAYAQDAGLPDEMVQAGPPWFKE